jgi:hypothetical protein
VGRSTPIPAPLRLAFSSCLPSCLYYPLCLLLMLVGMAWSCWTSALSMARKHQQLRRSLIYLCGISNGVRHRVMTGTGGRRVTAGASLTDDVGVYSCALLGLCVTCGWMGGTHLCGADGDGVAGWWKEDCRNALRRGGGRCCSAFTRAWRQTCGRLAFC